MALLVPPSLSPQDGNNSLLQVERAFQDGIAELEQAGHPTEGITVYAYVHRLQLLEKKQAKQ